MPAQFTLLTIPVGDWTKVPTARQMEIISMVANAAGLDTGDVNVVFAGGNLRFFSETPPKRTPPDALGGRVTNLVSSYAGAVGQPGGATQINQPPAVEQTPISRPGDPAAQLLAQMGVNIGTPLEEQSETEAGRRQLFSTYLSQLNLPGPLRQIMERRFDPLQLAWFSNIPNMQLPVDQLSDFRKFITGLGGAVPNWQRFQGDLIGIANLLSGTEAQAAGEPRHAAAREFFTLNPDMQLQLALQSMNIPAFLRPYMANVARRRFDIFQTENPGLEFLPEFMRRGFRFF